MRGFIVWFGGSRACRWVEAVFSLVWAVVSVQLGAAAMTECGLIPALLNVVQLNMDGQGFGGMGQPFHRRYVVSQAIQIMETAVVNNNTALATFREMDAAEVSTKPRSSVQHSEPFISSFEVIKVFA